MGQVLALSAEKRGPGAPRREFEADTANALCEALAESECGIFDLIKSRSDLPDWLVVNRWRREHPSFNDEVLRAQDARLDRIADGLITLADEGRGNPTEVNAIKVQVSTRQWLLAKLRADTYGDKLDLTSKGEALQPASHQIDARVQSIVMQAARRLDASDGQALSDEARALLD